MTDHIKTILTNYHNAATLVACAFMEKYYKGNTGGWYWVGHDPIGGCLSVGDQFWNVEEMVDALRINATSKQLFAWYDSLDMELGKRDMNLPAFCKLMCKKKK